MDAEHADRRDRRPARGVARRALQRGHRLRGAGERVAPQVHRCRAGMGRGAAQRDPEVVRRGDRGDDAERVAVLLEHDALLDVQLDERVDRRRVDARVVQPVRVEAGVAQRVGHADAVAVAQPVQVGAREPPGGGAAADAAGAEARLLPRPGDELDRAPRHDAARAQQVDRLDRAEHADDAVVAAGVQRRVDVRAGQHERRVRVAAGPAPEQVADCVEPRLEARLAHPAGDALERRGVRRRVHLAGDPARRGVVVELGELGDRVVQPGRGGHRAEPSGRGPRAADVCVRSPMRARRRGSAGIEGARSTGTRSVAPRARDAGSSATDLAIGRPRLPHCPQYAGATPRPARSSWRARPA